MNARRLLSASVGLTSLALALSAGSATAQSTGSKFTSARGRLKVISYNVTEGFSGLEDQANPTACEAAVSAAIADPSTSPEERARLMDEGGDTYHEEDACKRDIRNAVDRIVALSGATVPDVVLLQEANGETAELVAARLQWLYEGLGVEYNRFHYQAVMVPPRHTVDLCNAAAMYPEPVDGECDDGDSQQAIKVVRDTAIVINTDTTAAVAGSGSWLRLQMSKEESCRDEDPETPIVEGCTNDHRPHRDQATIKLRELQAPNDRQDFYYGVMSAHLPGDDHFILDDHATELAVKYRWSGRIGETMQGHTGALTNFVGGDFNQRRCVAGTAETAACDRKNAWWTRLVQDPYTYRDTVLAIHKNDDSKLQAMSGNNYGFRIDFIFAQKLTCDADHDRGYTKYEKGDSRYASDHRAVMALVAAGTNPTCS